MTPRTTPSAADILRDAQGFSLFIGGPLFQLLRRAHLSDDALLLVRRRVAVITLFAWLPLFLLAALQGQLVGHSVAVPFLRDVEVHIRFLVVVPLLIVAELVVHQRLHSIGWAFLERKLIPEAAAARFDEALTSTFRLRNSVLAELLLLAVVYGVGVHLVWRPNTVVDVPTWYVTSSAAGSRLSPAGIWYGYVSLPIFQFLLLRWYYRLLLWTWFLWRVSRIELNLIPTHPDRVGGLGFLANTAYAFTLLMAAHGGMLAAQIANGIFFFGKSLPEFKIEIAVIVAFLLCIVFGPLLVFAPQLARAKRVGLLEYGTLAERYVREFDVKWLRGGASADEPLVGSGDIQSLADLSNSFEVVRGVRLAPVSKEALLRLTVAVLLPMAPLLLTMMPLETLLRKLVGLVF